MTKRIALAERADPSGKKITVVATVPDTCPNPALPAKPFVPSDRDVGNAYQVAHLKEGDVITLSFVNEAGADVVDPSWTYDQINPYNNPAPGPTYTITMPAPYTEGATTISRRLFGNLQLHNGVTYVEFAVETTVPARGGAGGTSPGTYFQHYIYVPGAAGGGSVVTKYDPDTGKLLKTSPVLSDTFPTGISPHYANREKGRIWTGDNRSGGVTNGILVGLLAWASIDDQFEEPAWTVHRMTGPLDDNRNANLITVVPVGEFIYGICYLRSQTNYYERDTFILKGKIDGTGTYEVKSTYPFVINTQGSDSESDAECPVAFGKYILFSQEGRNITGYDTETDTFKQLMRAPEDRAPDRSGGTVDVDLAFSAGRAADGSIWAYGIDEEAPNETNAAFYRSTLDNPVGVKVGASFRDAYFAYEGAGMVDEPYFRVAVNTRADYSTLRLHRVHMDTLVVELDVATVRFNNGLFSVSQSGEAVGGAVRAIPGDGPYQPPAAAKPGGNVGDLAFE